MKKIIAIILAAALILVCVLSVTAEDVSVKTGTDNLALSATASATDSHSSCPISNVNDGSLDTRWAPDTWQASKLPVWMQLSWDTEVTFDTLEIHERNNAATGNRANEFTVSVSDNGTNFTEIFRGYGIGMTGRTIKLSGSYTAKHIRVTFISVNEGVTDNPTITEFAVYCNNSPEETNLAKYATVDAISNYSDSNFNLHCGLLNDGNRNAEQSATARWTTREWRASTLATTPIWCQYEWSAPVEFNTVDIYEYKAVGVFRANEFRISVSDDGKTFTDIYTGYGMGEKRSVQLNRQIETRYMRITIYSVLEKVTDMPCINEIEVYNNERPLAMMAQISADSEEGHGVEYLNDGIKDGTNYWTAKTDSELPIGITFKWKKEVSLDTIILYEQATNGKYAVNGFNVEASVDGDKWETVFVGTQIGEAFEARLSRTVYVTELRINFTEVSATDRSLSLREIEFYNNNTGIEPQNYAIGADVTASSIRPAYGSEDFDPGNITDANRNNRYVPLDNAKMPLTITLSWENIISFDRVDIYEWKDGNGNYRADSISIKTSINGTEWQPFYDGNGIGSCLSATINNPINAKYLQLSINSIKAGLPESYKPCICEIEVMKQSDSANLLGFSCDGKITLDDKNATATVSVAESVVDLSKAFDPGLVIVDGATVNPKGPQNFNAPIKYTITSSNGKISREYTVMVEYEKMLSDDDLTDKGSDEVEAFGPTPSPSQYRYQKQEMAAFCHFGMKTFTNQEVMTEKVDISNWTLSERADTDGYIKTLKDAGFDMVIFTAKHHDGLCMWDTAMTDFKITNTVYGEDFLAQISESCNKYDMDMGLYLQPWDIHSKYYGYYDENGNQTDKEHDVLDYNDYYATQLEEILSNEKYGHNGVFREIWLDGAKISSEPQDYDFERYVQVMHKYEGKDVLIFGVTKYAKVRWCLNESGVANEETWSKSNGYLGEDGIMYCNDLGEGVKYKGTNTSKGYKNGNIWTVNEVDTVLTSGWFWGPNKHTPKTLENMREIYLDSVGHNSVLLLNVPINTSGTLDPAIKNRIIEFGTNVKQSFETGNMLEQDGVKVYANEVLNDDIKFKPSNVFDGNDNTYWTANDGSKEVSLRIDFGKKVTFDTVVIEEAIQFGQRVESFKIMYKNDAGRWTTFSQGTTVGGKRVALENAITTDEMIIYLQGMTDNVTGKVGTPVISHIGAYKATPAFEKSSGAPEGIESYDNTDQTVFSYTGWENVENIDCVSGGFIKGTKNDSMTLSFKGTKAWLIGNKGTGAYSFSVSVDGKTAKTITYSPTTSMATMTGQILYETEDLSDGTHAIELTVLSGSPEIDALFVLNNGGKGYLEFEKDAYTVNEDMSYEIKIVRKGGSKGKISALIQDMPGSAVQTHYYNTEGIRVDFADGEREKTFTLRTMRYTEETGTLSFTLEIINADEEDNTFAAGFNTPVLVNIIDAESYEGDFVKSFEIQSLPDKLIYKLGDFLDLTGLKIKATYITGDTRILYADQYRADVNTLDKLGEKTVTLSAIYDDVSVSFKVKVAENGDVNGDGNIDVCDLVAIKLGNEAGDINDDGKINNDDAEIIRRIIINNENIPANADKSVKLVDLYKED